MTQSNGETVRSLIRGFKVIEAFGGTRRAKTLSDIARGADLSRATARRLLLTLIDLGYVATDGKQFALTPKILSLSYPYLSSVALTDLLLPHMENVIGSSMHVSSSSAMLDKASIVFIAALPAKGLVRTWMTVGLRVPATLSSMGRVMLAHLPPDDLARALDAADFEPRTPYSVTDRAKVEELIADARVNGFSVCDRELDPAIRSCGVPIYDRQGRCWAAMSVSCHDPQRATEDFVGEFVPKLKTASQLFSTSMPYDPFLT